MKEVALLHLHEKPFAGEAPAQLRTILAPIDYSQPAMFAFRYALSLAERFGGKVIALSVVQNPVVYPAFTEEDEQEFVDQAQRKLYAACREVAGKPRDFEIMVRIGIESVAEEIDRAAQDVAADLIVVPANHRAAIGRILFGGTGERIARHAPCPVLMVPVLSQPIGKLEEYAA